jgi:type II secretory pathway pseudopilin PulG
MKKIDTALAIIAVIVVAVLIAAFVTNGNPFEKQKQARDQQRLSGLSQISTEVQNYYQKNKKVPDNMTQLDTTYLQDLRDPQTNNPYEYQKVDDERYKLCATFETNTKEQNAKERIAMPPYSEEYPDTTHPTGNHCIQYKIPYYLKETPPPVPTPLNSPTPTVLPIAR